MIRAFKVEALGSADHWRKFFYLTNNTEFSASSNEIIRKKLSFIFSFVVKLQRRQFRVSFQNKLEDDNRPKNYREDLALFTFYTEDRSDTGYWKV